MKRGRHMICFKKGPFVLTLFLLTLTVFFGGCGVPADSNGYEVSILREIQAELADLRAENNDLRESNERLLENLEDMQGNAVEESAPVSAANDPIVVEIHVAEAPSPTPVPSPTPYPSPEPVSLFGRWVTVGAMREGTAIDVPAEHSMEIYLSSNGTGNLNIQGVRETFIWTGGDTGDTGRIVMSFTGHFGSDAQDETMTYRISGPQLNLTHTIFGETITTILRKAE